MSEKVGLGAVSITGKLVVRESWLSQESWSSEKVGCHRKVGRSVLTGKLVVEKVSCPRKLDTWCCKHHRKVGCRRKLVAHHRKVGAVSIRESWSLTLTGKFSCPGKLVHTIKLDTWCCKHHGNWLSEKVGHHNKVGHLVL